MPNSKEYYKKYRKQNREKIRAKQREWYLLNLDKANAATARYEKSEKGKSKLAERAKTIKYKTEALKRANKYKNENLDRYRSFQRKYQAQRRCLGGNLSAKTTIDDFYNLCPKGMEIDHIIPIKNDLVCGLHVVWNMQYLTRSENAKKSNNFDLTYDNLSWKK